MPDLGPYAGFIILSYGITALVVAGLVAWVVMDGRLQNRTLAELNARGVRRRSAAN